MKWNVQRKPILLYLLVLIILTVIVLLPIVKPGFIQTDDGEWMVIRLSSFYQSLADGQFPVRFLGRLNQNYGYPVANFLYPGFLYVGSALHLLKIPFSQSVEIILSASVFMGAVGVFFWLRTFFGPLAGLVGSGTFLFCPYLLYDLYKRGSVGELFAIGIAAVTLLVIEKRWRVILPLCIFCLLVSHNTLALLFSLFFIFYIAVKKDISLYIPMIIGGIMASFFWMPALFERSFVAFQTIAVANPSDFFGISLQLASMSLPFIGAWIFMLMSKKKQFSKETNFFIAVFVTAGFFALPVSSIFWKSPLLAQLVQFPYRWYAIWLLVGPWLVAAAVSSLKKEKKILSIGVIILLCAFTGYGQLTGVKSQIREEGYYFTNEATTTVADEYMPRWVMEKPQKRPDGKLEFFSGRGTFFDTEFSTKKIVTNIKAEEDSIVQVNTVFYPGWGAMLDDKPVEISNENLRGLIQITVPKGTHTMLVEFRETFFRFIADISSAIGFFLYGFFMLYTVLHGKETIRLKKPVFKDLWE